MKLSSSVAAVVTGGASGPGAATSRALAAQGVKVAIFDFNVEKGEAIAREIGGVFYNVDVTSDSEVDAGFRRLVRPTARSGSWSTALAQATR